MNPKDKPPGGTLVIADDDDFICRMLTQQLQPLFSRIVTTANGNEALSLIRSCRPSAVILDMLLPGLNGYEILAALRASPENSKLPVLIISGMGGVGRDMLPQERGNCLYISKPFDFDEITRGLRALLDEGSEEAERGAQGDRSIP